MLTKCPPASALTSHCSSCNQRNGTSLKCVFNEFHRRDFWDITYLPLTIIMFTQIIIWFSVFLFVFHFPGIHWIPTRNSRKKSRWPVYCQKLFNINIDFTIYVVFILFTSALLQAEKTVNNKLRYLANLHIHNCLNAYTSISLLFFI